ncbi:MAG: hypothetical protein QW561_00495 [Candidatus Aenigmatarchaeota archaeon]
MTKDIEKAIENITEIAKSMGGWVTEKKTDKGKEILYEITISFKVKRSD